MRKWKITNAQLQFPDPKWHLKCKKENSFSRKFYLKQPQTKKSNRNLLKFYFRNNIEREALYVVYIKENYSLSNIRKLLNRALSLSVSHITMKISYYLETAPVKQLKTLTFLFASVASAPFAHYNAAPHSL